MDAQRSSSALGKHVEIATRLRRLDDAKARLLAGHLEISSVGGDLQEHAAVRPALVGLAGRMQEARPELGAGRDMLWSRTASRIFCSASIWRRRARYRRGTPHSRRGRCATDAPIQERACRRRRPAQFGGVLLVGVEIGLADDTTGCSAGSSPVFSKAPVSSRVLILAASTSGWLNGLMPMIAPATAVANSKRKNSWPMMVDRFHDDPHHGMPGLFQRCELFVLRASSSSSVRRSMKKRSLP